MSRYSHFTRKWIVRSGVKLLVSILACAAPPHEDAVWIRIPQDASIEAVAESLAAHGIVGSPRSFERFARMGRKHLGVKPGMYPLRPNTPMGKVLVMLRQGRPDATRVRVQPGVWLAELLPAMSRGLDIPLSELSEAVRDSTVRAEVGATSETLEGYFYPTTYYIPVHSTALDVVRQMVDTFEAHWELKWNSRLDSIGMTRHEIVTLASIIEGEAPHDTDRDLMSSVYHNRLSRGLRLQADPTVVYALGRRTRLYNKDYRLESDYNMYRRHGLPPGPINQPTTASLLAALYPRDTEYLYFVASVDGHHTFSRTYGEHLTKIREVRNNGR
jgi:UPF0755 protein